MNAAQRRKHDRFLRQTYGAEARLLLAEAKLLGKEYLYIGEFTQVYIPAHALGLLDLICNLLHEEKQRSSKHQALQTSAEIIAA